MGSVTKTEIQTPPPAGTLGTMVPCLENGPSWTYEFLVIWDFSHFYGCHHIEYSVCDFVIASEHELIG